MANTKHEDAILKMGFDYFRDTILKTLGIDYEFVETGATELVELTIHSLYMDFTFLTTGDFYIHIEFQTTDSGKKDLRRFHAYESVLAHKTGKNVIFVEEDFAQLALTPLMSSKKGGGCDDENRTDDF